jgi:CRISPR-associated protein Cmr1
MNYTVTIKPLTPIWTGDALRESPTLRETGIIGSLRWWYEALIRGLGGTACDPTNTKCDGKNHCIACELFGCTGWARKFRLEIEEINGKEKKEEYYRFKFIELRKIEDVEWALLNLTLHFIAKYAAIGGKIVLKPSDESNRQNKDHHKDYGLIEIVKSELKMLPLNELKKYVQENKFPNNIENNTWLSIKNFWFVDGKYLFRKSYDKSTFNKVIGRIEKKGNFCNLINANDKTTIWLAGSQKESKKVFSFKKPSRTFGFIKPDIINFERMETRLKDVWGTENDWKFLKGDEILKCLENKLM